MDYLSAVIQYAPVVVGFVMPLLVELINRDVTNAKVRFIVTVVLCSVVAALLNIPKILVGNVSDLFTTLTLIFGESQVVYNLYFKASALKESMQRTPATIVVTQ